MLSNDNIIIQNVLFQTTAYIHWDIKELVVVNSERIKMENPDL